MANPYRDKQGQFSSSGSGGKGAAKSGGGKSSGKTVVVRVPKAKKTKAKSFSKAERMRGTDAPRGRRGSKADRMADTF